MIIPLVKGPRILWQRPGEPSSPRFVVTRCISGPISSRQLLQIVRFACLCDATGLRLAQLNKLLFSGVGLEAWLSCFVEFEFCLAVVGACAAWSVAGVHDFGFSLGRHGLSVGRGAYSSCGKGPRSATSQW